MSSPLDMTLDEIIRKNRRPRGNSSHFHDKVTGPDRRVPHRPHLRKTVPYELKQQNQNAFTKPMQVSKESIMGGQPSNMASAWIPTNAETKLYISNLDYDVSDRDIETLFSGVGELKSHTIHYDRSGRSKGTAEVLFYREVDAQTAIRRFNDVCLDGKPLKIELVGVHLVAHDPPPPTNTRILENPYCGGFKSGQGRVHAKGTARGGAFSTGVGRGMARGRRHGNPHETMLAAKDLDTDLDKYRLEA